VVTRTAAIGVAGLLAAAYVVFGVRVGLPLSLAMLAPLTILALLAYTEISPPADARGTRPSAVARILLLVFVATYCIQFISKSPSGWSRYSAWPNTMLVLPTRSDALLTISLSLAGMTAVLLPFHFGRRIPRISPPPGRTPSSGYRDANAAAVLLGAGLFARLYTVLALTSGVRLSSDGKLQSTLIYVGLWTPLVAASALVVSSMDAPQRSRQRHAQFRLGIAGFAAYAALGLQAESKSGAFLGLLCLLAIHLNQQRFVPWRPQIRDFLWGGLAIALALLVFSFADAHRAATSHSPPPQGSLLRRVDDRLGGMSFALPVVAAAVRKVPSTGSQVEALNVRVYGLPPNSKTAFAAPIWALLYWRSGPFVMLGLCLLAGCALCGCEFLCLRERTIWSAATAAVIPVFAYLLVFEGGLAGGVRQLAFLMVQFVALRTYHRHVGRSALAV